MSSADRGECVTTGGLYRPTHLCVAHFELHKKKFHTVFCFGVVRLGGCLERGGGWSMIQEVGVCMGFQGGGVIWVQGSHSLGEKAVEQSGGAGSDAPVPSS